MFWSTKECVDEIFFVIHNIYKTTYLLFLRTLFRSLVTQCNAHFENSRQKSKDYCIIANGPSSLDHKLSNEKQHIFVNFGFNHPNFAIVQNPILVIVDKKLLTGEWSLSMLSEAKRKNPNVCFAFGGHLLRSKSIRDFADKNHCCFIFYDLSFTRFTSFQKFSIGDIAFGGGATESSIMLAVSLGAKHLNIYGYDGNNVVLGLAGLDTHFYGNDPLKNWNRPAFVARELRFLSYFIDKNVYLSQYLRALSVSTINHTQTKYMRMYHHESD